MICWLGGVFSSGWYLLCTVFTPVSNKTTRTSNTITIHRMCGWKLGVVATVTEVIIAVQICELNARLAVKGADLLSSMQSLSFSHEPLHNQKSMVNDERLRFKIFNNAQILSRIELHVSVVGGLFMGFRLRRLS